MDTLTAFAEPVEQLGRVECLDGRVKAVMLEMLSEELEVAVDNLEKIVIYEDKLLQEPGRKDAEFMVKSIGGDVDAWTAAVANILAMGQQVLETRSCNAEPPADMMARWRETFGREAAVTSSDIIP